MSFHVPRKYFKNLIHGIVLNRCNTYFELACNENVLQSEIKVDIFKQLHLKKIKNDAYIMVTRKKEDVNRNYKVKNVA